MNTMLPGLETLRKIQCDQLRKEQVKPELNLVRVCALAQRLGETNRALAAERASQGVPHAG